MNVTLTTEDEADLRAGHSINAGSQEGPDVVLLPNYFEPPMWAVLEAGGKVMVDTNIYESSQRVEVQIGLAS